MTPAEERKLIRRAAAGDRDAAAQCIRAHQASLYGYLMRLSGRPEVAEDIVQEAFVRVLTNLDRFDSRFRFSTWLFTIARRLYINASEKRAPRFDSDLVEGREGGRCAPEGRPLADERRALARDSLNAALQRLAPDQREVLVLFHQLSWPIALIAQHMDMPEGTVKSHLHRGRRRLRDFLNTDAPDLVEEPWA